MFQFLSLPPGCYESQDFKIFCQEERHYSQILDSNLVISPAEDDVAKAGYVF